MPTNVFLLSLAAGIISAVVFASATTGAMLLRVVLFFLTPLSLYLAGLGLGTVAAAIAGITATTLVLLMANPLAAEVYAISTALPALVCTRLAVLSRDTDGEREWYPIGRIVAVAAVFAGVFAILALILHGRRSRSADQAAPRCRTRASSRQSCRVFQVRRQSPPPRSTTITRSTLSSLPWALGLLAMGTILLNLWLAGRITLASGRLKRPWPDLANFTMPASATFALLVALGLSFVDGMRGSHGGWCCSTVRARLRTCRPGRSAHSDARLAVAGLHSRGSLHRYRLHSARRLAAGARRSCRNDFPLPHPRRRSTQTLKLKT